MALIHDIHDNVPCTGRIVWRRYRGMMLNTIASSMADWSSQVNPGGAMIVAVSRGRMWPAAFSGGRRPLPGKAALRRFDIANNCSSFAAAADDDKAFIVTVYFWWAC